MDNQQISNLTLEIRKLNRQFSFGNSLIRGVLSGLGSAVGASLILAVVVYFLSRVQFIPLIGEWTSNLVNEILMNLPVQR